MADGVTITPGVGKTVATDEIAGQHHQRVKITVGADGVNDGDVSSANPMPVTAASLPLPSGAATSAKQDTAAAILATMDADTGAIATSVASIDGKTPALVTGRVPVDGSGVTQPVSGTFWQATQPISAAALPLPSGAATEATLATLLTEAAFQARINTLGAKTSANSTPVVLASDQAAIPVTGTFWQATQPMSSTQLPAALVSGRLDINIGASSATVPISGSITATSADTIADNAGFTDGTSKVLPVGFIYDEVAGTALTENDVAAPRINVNRGIVTVFEDGSTRGRYATVTASNAVKVDGSAVTQPVSGTFWQATQPVSIAATVTVGGVAAHDAAVSGNPSLIAAYASAAAPTNVSADGDVVRVWALRSGAQCVQLTAAGALIGGDATGGMHAQGAIAHDGVDSGNPVKVGFKAGSALPTAVAANDRADGRSDLFGRQLVSHIPPEMVLSKTVNVTTTQTGSDVLTPTSGKKLNIISVIVSSYGTTAARVILWFGANADTTYTAGTDVPVVVASFAPSATAKPGLVFCPAVPLACQTADHELHLTTDAGISLDITVTYYET